MRKVETQNPFTNKKKEITINNLGTIYGGKENKKLISVFLGNSKKKRQMTMVERGPYIRGPHVIEKILELWKACKACGIPVVPTLRITADQTLIATDMKANGSEIYGKAMSMYFPEFRSNYVLDVDKHFISQYNLIKNDIIHQAYRLAEFAAKNGILLPVDDAFELIFQKNGDWELIVLDLYLADVDTDKPGIKRIEQLLNLNESAIELALDAIENVYLLLMDLSN